MDIKDKNKEKHLNELMVGVRERIGKHRDSLAELADEVIQLQVEEMSAKAKVLAQIAGGAEKGALWHADFDAKKTTILEHFRVTLDKIKGQQVDSARDATQKAHDEVLKMDGSYSRLCERSFLEKETRSSALTSARHSIVRGCTQGRPRSCCARRSSAVAPRWAGGASSSRASSVTIQRRIGSSGCKRIW